MLCFLVWSGWEGQGNQPKCPMLQLDICGSLWFIKDYLKMFWFQDCTGSLNNWDRLIGLLVWWKVKRLWRGFDLLRHFQYLNLFESDRACLYSRMVSDWPQETLVTLVTTVMQVRDNIYLDCVNDQQDADHMSTVNTTFTTLLIGFGQWVSKF